MQFETKRLILREYLAMDWETAHAYGSDPEFCKYELWGPNSVEDTKGFINRTMQLALTIPRVDYELAVCLKSDNTHIGGCGLSEDGNGLASGNIAWAIHPKHQSQGYATEAAEALMDFGYNVLQLSKIHATCDTRNMASIKVMEKLGMKQISHSLNDRNFKGSFFDSFTYEK